jgi:lysophospholipase L1-like esterase
MKRSRPSRQYEIHLTRAACSLVLLPSLILFGTAGSAHCANAESAPATVTPAAPAPDLARNPTSSAPVLNPKLPTLFVVGDSTAARVNGKLQQGWAVPFADYFDQTKVNIVNRARGGRSSRTFITEGLWNDLLADMKSGDVVMIQLGHNDGGALNDTSRARGSIKGIGEETEEIDNLLTKKHEVVHTYGWYLRKFITDTRAKGATPIICSPVPRKIWKDGKIGRNKNDYGGWAEAVAKTEGVAFVDLNEIIARRYDELGPDKVDPLFSDEHTHTSVAGAELNAECVIAGLKALTNNPVEPYLRAAPACPAPASLKFSFGSGPVAPGFVQVLPTTVYNKERGYGFEPGTNAFFFSARLPEEGNYRVTVTLGDATEETITTIKAELRRLMVEKIHTAPGKFATVSFIVNTRTPKISAVGDIKEGEVRLKSPRETTQEAWAWDDLLTLEFDSARPAVCAIEITKADVPTVFLLGDSTVCDQSREPYASWGQMLTRFFKPEVAVANHGSSGETYRDSIGRRRLDKILSVMKPGDYLIMQFGHNDQKQKGDGMGPFLNYKTEIKQHVDAVRERGGIPVVVSPVERRNFDENGKVRPSLADYAEAACQSAKELNVAFIDLNAMSIPFYEALGPEKSKLAFAKPAPDKVDNTHHDNYGAYELAKCIVQGIKNNKLDLAKYIVDDFKGFDPTHPDPVESFDVPPSPQVANQPPLGN